MIKRWYVWLITPNIAGGHHCSPSPITFFLSSFAPSAAWLSQRRTAALHSPVLDCTGDCDWAVGHVYAFFTRPLRHLYPCNACFVT